jgi:NADH:ubiquinone oxidoreductase subunit K
MAKKQHNSNGQPVKPEFIFQKKNYLFMFVGIAFIALGFILMVGGGSDDPNTFNPDIFNFRRIRLAPTLVLIGLGIEIYAILLNPHKKRN